MTVMRRLAILFAASAAVAGASTLASAQGSVSALKGHDSNAPVDVSADRIRAASAGRPRKQSKFDERV